MKANTMYITFGIALFGVGVWTGLLLTSDSSVLGWLSSSITSLWYNTGSKLPPGTFFIPQHGLVRYTDPILNCSDTSQQNDWYKTYIWRCGDSAWLDYWKNITVLYGSGPALDKFMKAAANENKNFNATLCQSKWTYVKWSTYCIPKF